ncbi:hypothetical protein ACFL6O_03450 [candidate division KSB1 bacterium]
MTGSHLSDEKIQSYLDSRISKTEKNLIEKHLHLCSECTVKLENYELIFNELDQELNVELKEDFPERIISRIRNEQVEVEAKRELDPLSFLFVLVGISFAAAIIYYVDFSSIYRIISQLGNTAALQQKLINLMQNYVTVNKFFVLGGIGAGILLLMDKIIGRFFTGFKG